MVFIVEAIIGSILDQLTTLAVEEVNQEVRLVVGVKNQVKKLIKNFTAIQAVVADAEQKQLENASIKGWLKELNEISYEIEDVLDEWLSIMLSKSLDHSSASSRKASSSNSKKKLRNIVPSCFARFNEIGLRHDISHRIKDINETLDDIAARRKNYDLVPYGGVRVEKQDQCRITISDIVAEVKGRVEDEKNIVDTLLSVTGGGVVPQVICIVGMGGLGKTTLAQLAYNNASVQEHFDVKLWVTVSDPFDELKIGKDILESLNGSGGSGLQVMVQNIKERASGKRVLLVLDDVWNEDSNKWNNIKAALTTCKLPESKVLVTTRKDRVAKVMGCIEPNLIRPGHLSQKECWDIIASEVSMSGVTTGELIQLQEIGFQIADKCKGLPLAAKALGGLLRFKTSRQEWQSVLDSEMWQLGEEEAEIERDLFAPLWLSYHDLSPPQRRCLSFCGWFSKDAEISKQLLIYFWMGQGYLKESKIKDMEMVGEDYFRNLCARSFFQDFKKDGNGEIETVKMHDIVHDFILFISTNEFQALQHDCNFEDKELGSLREATRHLQIVGDKDEVTKVPDFIFSFKKLRTLKIEGFKVVDLRSLFNELTCLRVLVIEDCGITEIPSTIGRLVHLRLLHLLKIKN